MKCCRGGHLNDAKSLIEIEAEMQMAHTSLPHGGYNAGAHLACRIIYIEGLKLMVRKERRKRNHDCDTL